MIGYPVQIQPYTINWSYGANVLNQTDLDKIRTIIKDEVHKALHPEESQPSSTVEYTQDGKTWRGKVYLVEEDEEEEDE